MICIESEFAMIESSRIKLVLTLTPSIETLSLSLEHDKIDVKITPTIKMFFRVINIL